MKKIFLIIASLFLVSNICFAEIEKEVDAGNIRISSRYSTNEIKILYIRTRTTAGAIGHYGASKIILYPNEKSDLLLSFDNPPQIEFTINHSIGQVILPQKYSCIGPNTMLNFLNGKQIENIKSSSKVVLLMPTTNNEIKKIEIPNDILQEWKYIASTNMGDEKKLFKEA